METTTATSRDDKDTKAGKKGFLYRFLRGFYAQRDSMKRHPVWGTLLALVVLVVGVAGSEAYAWVRNKIVGPDEFLVQVAEDQKHEFAELKASLRSISSSIDSGDKAAFRQVQGAVKSIEKTNTSLIQQLALAKQENDKLRKITEQKAGVSGGYDIMLSSGSAIRLDSSSILGVEYVTSGGVVLNLTSSDSDKAHRTSLSSGQSTTYHGSGGEPCKVSLLSFDGSGVGSASFAVNCNGGKTAGTGTPE